MDDEVAPVDLDAELASARKRIDELARAYQSLERDREEFKRRLQRERERLIDVERGEVALALLEAIDDLDLALAEADDTPLARGVRVIRENLLKKLEHLGIERVPVVGTSFDPNLAEAADLEVTPEAEKDNTVTAELRAGYRLKNKDRVVRPARVKVARYVKAAEA
jgi:molecular chaperone GrpE